VWVRVQGKESGGKDKKERTRHARANSLTRAEKEREREGERIEGVGAGRRTKEARCWDFSGEREAEKCSAAEEVGEEQGIALVRFFSFLRQNLFRTSVRTCVQDSFR